jgi:release factor glutamine methyltransferase
MDWTIRALMDWTENHFQQNGIETPRLEAQLLLAHALNCRRVELYTRWDEVVNEGPRGQFRELVKRRLDGCPSMYLIGRREFYALEFEVSPAVLIPRPETESLVTEALKRGKDLPNARILDVGTGSGCLAVSLAFQNKTARITATDISADSLAIARRNAERQPAHIREHEPKLALLGGPDGFAIYNRLIPAAVEFLEPDGYLILEMGATQEAGLHERLQAAAHFDIGPTIRDQAGLPRVVTARRR